MYSTPEFRDIDGTILQYGDVVVLRKWSESMVVCTCEDFISVEQPEEFLVGLDELEDLGETK